MRRAITALTMLFAFAITLNAPAAILPRYSEDSLIVLSADIVEATVGQPDKKFIYQIGPMKVDAVYKGSHKVGDTLSLVDTSFYCKYKNKDDDNPIPLEAGDKVLLYLSPPKEKSPYVTPAEVGMVTPLPAGLFLIQGDTVIPFVQGNNPGPYVSRKPLPAKLADHRKHVQERITHFAPLVEGLEKKKLPQDVDWFIDELAKRLPPPDLYSQEAIAPLLEKKLIDEYDQTVIIKAYTRLAEKTPPQLAQGLRSTEGRERAIAFLTDPKIPAPAKLAMAKSLQYIGWGSEDPQVDKRPPQKPVEPAGENRGFITKLANFADSPDSTPEISEMILRRLADSLEGPNSNHELSFVKDRTAAFAVLKQIYARPTTSEPIRFYIEVFAAHLGEKAYSELPGSPPKIPSLVMLSTPPPDAKPREIAVTVSFDVTLVPEIYDPGTRLMLLDTLSGKTWDLGPMQGGSSAPYKELPARGIIPTDLPHPRSSRIVLQVQAEAGPKYLGHGIPLER